MIIAPEALVTFAFSDFQAASRCHHFFRQSPYEGVQRWSRLHASFANMGGLMFRMQWTDQEDVTVPSRKEVIEIDNEFSWNRTTFREFGRWIGRIRHLTVLPQFIPSVFRGIFSRGRVWATPRKDESDRSSEEIEMLQPNVLHKDQQRRKVQKRSAPELSSTASTRGYQDSGQVPNLMQSSDLGETDLACLADGGLSFSIRGEPSTCEPDAASETSSSEVPANQYRCLYLNAVQIVVAQILGILDEGPNINEDDIADKSKSNLLGKIFAVASLGWTALGICIQLGKGEQLTQLELATSVYVVCAMVAYFLHWNKPQAVERPVKYDVKLSGSIRALSRQDLEMLQNFGGSPFLKRNLDLPFGMDQNCTDVLAPIPTDNSLTIFANVKLPYAEVVMLFYDADFAAIFMGLFIGGLYCFGWNQTFPSTSERVAWSTASIAISSIPAVYATANLLLSVHYFDLVESRGRGKSHIIHSITLFSLLGLYIIGRLFMLFEMVKATV